MVCCTRRVQGDENDSEMKVLLVAMICNAMVVCLKNAGSVEIISTKVS